MTIICSGKESNGTELHVKKNILPDLIPPGKQIHLSAFNMGFISPKVSTVNCTKENGAEMKEEVR